MDIIETRRENLRRWVDLNGAPVKEKSLFSQLKSTGSFGEKVARRLEQQYRMGSGYLDTPSAPVQKVEPISELAMVAVSLTAACETADEQRLLTTYRLADEVGRRAFDATVTAVLKRMEDGAWDER